jgi:hypothetical protein
VLDRLDDPTADASAGRRWASRTPRLVPLAAGIALAVLVAVLWVALPGGHLEPSEIDRLAAERSRIAAELEALRREADDTPVIYLGGDDQVDLVLDLDHLARSGVVPRRDTDPRRSPRADVRPATY